MRCPAPQAGSDSASIAPEGNVGLVFPLRLTGWAVLPLLLWVVLLSGCRSVDFYAQAIGGHSAIVLHKKKLTTLLLDPDTPPELSHRLGLVTRLCEFARSDLRLPAGKNYRHYVDLGRAFVVWNIHAAPEFSLDSKRWWYPFVGQLSYRGYFAEAKARRYAAYLEGKGYEVFVGGVDAYSTLGWFCDPVLNTFIHRGEEDLADLIFHELAHREFFAGGDTDFNEAFATTVAREGVRRWLTRQGKPEALAAWQERVRREDQFLALVLSARASLENLYGEPACAAHARSSSPPPAASNLILREKKAAVFRRLREQYEAWKAAEGGVSDLDPWFDLPVNNARLNAEATYYALMPSFQRLLSSQDNDLPRFYQAVRRLGRLKSADRLAALERCDPAITQPRRSIQIRSCDP